MNTEQKIRPSKYRYFWLNCISVLAITLPVVATVYFLQDTFRYAKVLFYGILLWTPIHLLFILIETLWIEDDLSIVISDKQISGPSGSGLRFDLTRWKRLTIPLCEIDKTKTKNDLYESRGGKNKCIWSKQGDVVFISEVFTNDQIETILEKLDV